MKNRILIILLCSLFACKSSKFEIETPFNIKKASFQHWVGGQQGVKGIHIKLLIADLSEAINLQFVYFNHKKVKLYLKKDETDKLFTANINTSDGIDMIIHKDPKKEYGNKIPNATSKIPFELKENEAVISYLENKIEKFYKVILTEENSVVYP